MVCICGDIPASNYIGGFKEGVGFAFRKCRRCLATADDMRAKVCYYNTHTLYQHTPHLCSVATVTDISHCHGNQSVTFDASYILIYPNKCVVVIARGLK